MHMPFIVSFTNPAGSSSVSEAETEVGGELEGLWKDLDVLGRNWSSSSITKSSTALVLTMEWPAIIFNCALEFCVSQITKINWKKVQQNSWNQINQFHEKEFWPKAIFCNFKNVQKSIFELTEYFPWKLKVYLIFMENIQKKFHEIDLFDFKSFFASTF